MSTLFQKLKANPTKDPSLRTKLDPRKATTLLLLIFQCGIGIVLMCQRGCPPPLPSELGIGNRELGVNSKLPTPNSQLLYVHVVGNVKSPGVYKFPVSSNPTRQDAITAAGGLLVPHEHTLLEAKSAVKSASSPIKDEEQVLIE